MPLGWTTFCSTFSGLSADLWDQCQPFLLSHSLNTAFPKTQLFLMLWVNSLAPQGQMLIETSRQTLHGTVKHDCSLINGVGCVFPRQNYIVNTDLMCFNLLNALWAQNSDFWQTGIRSWFSFRFLSQLFVLVWFHSFM